MKEIRQRLLDNLSFDKNEDVERADAALDSVLRKEEFWGVLRGLTLGFDKDNGDVLFFFPIEELLRNRNEIKDKFLSNLIEAWTSANFEVIEQAELSNDAYFHVGFRSLFFRLRNRN